MDTRNGVGDALAKNKNKCVNNALTEELALRRRELTMAWKCGAGSRAKVMHVRDRFYFPKLHKMFGIPIRVQMFSKPHIAYMSATFGAQDDVPMMCIDACT